MDHFLATLIGMALGLWLASRSGWKVKSLWQKEREPASAAAPAASLVEPPIEPVAPVATSALSTKLHELEAVFSPIASNLAHPRELEDQPQFAQAVNLLEDAAVPLDTVMQYVLGANWPLACAGLAALKRRPDRNERIGLVVAQFDKLYPWPIYFALSYLLSVEPRPPLGDPVAGVKDWWAENLIVPGLFRDHFAERERLGDEPVFGSALSAGYASTSAQIRSFLQRVNHTYAATLIRQLDSVQRASVDRAFLSSFGRFWVDRKEPEILIEPELWKEALVAAEAASLQTPTRSVLVSGEHRVGKTTFLRLLAQRLDFEGWTVFEASAADLMAGQQWFGQLEGRIQRTVEELSAAKKLIWYIPDILQMARSGTHQGQAASVLDQILPAVVSGRLIVWTEAMPTSTARLLQLRPTLRGLFETVRLEPQSQDETASLAQAWVGRLADEGDMTIDADCVQVALSSARQYLSAANFPGSVLDLIKLTAGRVLKGGSDGPIPRSDRHAGPAHGPASLDPRQQGACRSRRDPRSFHELRYRPGRGGDCHRRAHRHAQGRPQRSGQADRRVSVCGPDGHRQDRARQDGGRVPVRLGRPHDPPRHERVPDARSHAQDPRQAERRRELAHQSGPQAAVLGGAARRVREGARLDLGPVPAGVR